MKKKFGVEASLKQPKVPYLETIRKRGDRVQGRHKKQTGGRGQFGDCWIEMEPLTRGSGFEFVDKIFGGSIPQNFRPAVQKGIVESSARGWLAGFPVVDFRVILVDGSYHDGDSSEIAFKIAGSLAFKAAMEKASPTLLEPIMSVEITAPEDYMGDIMGDLSSRRGKPQGMEAQGHYQVIKRPGPAVGDTHVRIDPQVDQLGPRHVPAWNSTTTTRRPPTCRRRSSPSGEAARGRPLLRGMVPGPGLEPPAIGGTGPALVFV